MNRAVSVRNAAMWSMSAQYVAFAVQFAVSVIISRFFLAPAEVGVFSIALSAAMLVAVLQDFGIARYVAGQQNLSDDQIATCFSVSIVFAGVVGLVILALAWPVSRFYGNHQLFTLLVIVAASYLVVPFGIVPNALLARRMDFRSLFFVNVGGAVVNGTVALALAAAGYSALSLAWALVAQVIVRTALGQWLSGTRIPMPMTLKGALPILKFGSASSGLYVSGAIGSRSPELIIGRMLTLTAVGLYGRASSLAAQLRMLVSGAMGSVFFPAFARLRDHGADLSEPYLRVVSAYCAVTWPAMAGLAAAATPIVLGLYGATWEGVAPLLIWIALAEMPLIALPMHIEMPIVLGKIGPLIRYNVVDTVASVGLLVMACFWSVEWAAISRIGYALIWYAIYARFMQSLIGFRWRAMIAIYLRSALVSVAAVVPILLAYRFWQAPADMALGAFAACALAGAASWLAAMFIVRHPARAEFVDIGRSAVASLRAT